MSSIDERIVKMTFDNDKFEAGVKKTLETLENLKEKLTFKNHENTFKGIETSMNNVSFNGIESGIDSLNKRFSTLGIVGMEVTRRITNAAIDAGKKIANATVGQIKSGGMTRALNIEQARFQLKGLGLDVEGMLNAANNAVTDTAYGLDEAAKAASVLGASGITDLQKMEDTLKSIAGAAAMTGRGYSDIADIYATVASTGRLYTQQLNQFAHSGLNVRAVLMEAYHLTGEELQEMVKKGEISFDMFNKAMSKFGEHAKEANNTYQGALSNMKAALSRIGQMFATGYNMAEDGSDMKGYIENMRDLFNALIPLINNAKAALKPFAASILEIMTLVTGKSINIIEMLTGDKEKKIGPITDLVNGLCNAFNALLSVILPIGPAFKNIFPNATVANFTKLLSKFSQWTASLILNERQAKNMEYAYKGVFAVLKLIGTVVGTVIKGINRMLKPFGGLLNILNFIIGIIGRLVYAIATVITKVRLFSRIFTLVTSVLGFFFDLIVKLVKGIAQVVVAVSKFKPVVALFNTISTAFKTCAKFINLLIDRFKGLMKKIATFVGNAATKAFSYLLMYITSGLQLAGKYADRLIPKIKEFLNAVKKSKAMQVFSTVVDNSRKYLSLFADKLKEAGKAFGNWVTEHQLVQRFFSVMSSGLQIVYSIISTVINKVKEFAKSIYEFVKDTGLLETFIDIFHKGFDKIKDVLKIVVEHLKTFKDFVVDNLKGAMEDAAKTAETTGGRINKSFIFETIKNFFKRFIKEIQTSIFWLGSFGKGIKNFYDKYIKGIFGELISVTADKLKEFIELFKNMNAKEILDYFPSQALGLFLISLALFIRRLRKSTRQISGAVGKIGDFFAQFTNPLDRTSASKWRERGKTLLSFAASIYIVAKAIQTLGEMDPKKLAIGIGAMAGAVAIMSISIGLLGKALNGKGVNMAATGLGMLLLATSLLIMAKAVEKFGSIDKNALIQGLLGVAGALIVLTAAVSFGLGKASHMISTALGLMVLAAALVLFLKVLQVYNDFDWSAISDDGLVTFISALFLLVGVVKLIGNVKGIASAGVGMILMAAAMLIMKSAVEKFGQMDWNTLAQGMVGVAFALLSISVAVVALDKVDAKGASKAILKLTVALLVITAMVKILGNMDYKSMVAALVGLTGMLVIMSMALYALNGKSDLLKTAGSLIMVAAALGIVAAAILVMGQIPFDTLMVALVGFAGMLVVMSLALYALGESQGSTLKAAASIVIMSAAVLVLAAALKVISTVPWENLKNGLIGLGLGLAAIVIAGAIGQVIGAGLIALAIALVAVGAVVLLVSAGIFIFVEALNILGQMGPESMQRVVDAIVVFINGLAEAVPLIMQAAVKIGLAFIQGLTILIPAIVALGLQMIVALLAGIAQNIDGIVVMAVSIIVSFIVGIAASLDMIVQAGLLLMFSFVNALADGIRTAGPLVIMAAKNLMAAVLEAILGQLEEIVKDIPVVGEKIAKGLSTAKDKVHDMFDVEGAKAKQKQMFDDLTSQIDSNTSPYLNKWDQLKGSLKEKFFGMSDEASSGGRSLVSNFVGPLQQGTGEASAASNALGDAGLSGITDIDKLAKQYGLEDANGYANGIMENLGLANGAGDMLGNSVLGQLGETTAAAPAEGSATASGYSGAIASSKPDIGTFLSLIGKAFGGKNSEFKTEGEKSGRSYADGLRGGGPQRAASDSARNLATNAGAAAGKVDWSGAGSACVSGFNRGISSNTFRAEAQASTMASAALRAAKAALDSQSPSKEFIKLGKDVDLGFIIGMARLQNKVYNAGYNVATQAIDAVSEPMKKVYDILNQDLDMNPTITPVLDLSQINDGVSRMNNMLDTNAISASVSHNMAGVGLSPAFAAAGNSTVSNNTTNTFNITVDGAENPEAFADRLVRQFQLRGRMA